MRHGFVSTSAGMGTLLFACAMAEQVHGFGGNGGTVCPTPVGPDVIVGDLHLETDYASQQIGQNWFDAFSFGTFSCNIGNQNLQWFQFSSNQHPAIAQNLYKLNIGPQYSKIEQIGLSWLKHGFAALTDNICGCGCANPGSQAWLGVGCADPYSAVRNGTQSPLGPRWQVNADTGYFPSGSPANPSWSGSTARRLRVNCADLEASSATVRFYAEAQYVAQDDSFWGNQNNNCSYKQVNMSVTVDGQGQVTNGTVNGFAGGTQREKPAIRAWKAVDATVTETDIQIPNEGLFIVASDATSLGNGMWHYEYAVYNMNSHLSGQAFRIPLPAGIQISNVGFHDVDYHSGDSGQGCTPPPSASCVGNFTNGSLNFDGTDWPSTIDADKISWATQTYAQNGTANAIRWGTTYNFRFDADLPPKQGMATLTTYREFGEYAGAAVVPAADCNDNDIADETDIANGTSVDANANGIPDECETPPTCDGDTNGDFIVNVDDLLTVINGWGGPSNGDVNGDNLTNVDDLLMVINNWGKCSP